VLERVYTNIISKLFFYILVLDDTISTLEELSSAPAEVLGRSSLRTSYKTTLDNGLLLRERVAKKRKELVKEIR